jgi:hypothetical protein
MLRALFIILADQIFVGEIWGVTERYSRADRVLTG